MIRKDKKKGQKKSDRPVMHCESNLVSGRIRDKKGPMIRQAGFTVQSSIVIYPLASGILALGESYMFTV